MAERGRCRPGGIRGLAELICDKPEECAALEFDLIGLGLRLRDFPSAQNTWHDLVVIVRNLGSESAYFRVTHPDTWNWDNKAMLQASMVDLLNILVWFKTADGQKGRNRPKLVPRPGVEPDKDTKHHGKGVPAVGLVKRLGLRVEEMLGIS